MLDKTLNEANSIRQRIRNSKNELNRIRSLLSDSERYIEGVVKISITSDRGSTVQLTNRSSIKACLENLNDKLVLETKDLERQFAEL